MSSDRWKERLHRIKEQERPETVLAIAGNSELIRVAVAWMGINAKRKKTLSPCPGDDEEAIWRWLWTNTAFSEGWFYSRIAGDKDKAERNFAVLVANRVLYPDGTVNGFVQRYLREKVLALFGMAKRNKPVV